MICSKNVNNVGLIDGNNLEWNETALKQVVQWFIIPDFYKDSYQKTIKDAIESGDNKIILTYDNGIIDYKELLRLMANSFNNEKL